jgi:uncharacterized protein YndB with AHSA1/START domain
MGEYRIDAYAETSASPEDVWRLLADGASWPTWSPIGSYELEKPGHEEKDGLGSVRIFSTRRTFQTARLREEVVEFEPPRRFRYAVRSGLPVRDYVGTVELEGTGGGTTIHWYSSFSAGPLLGRLVHRSLRPVITACATGLARHAEESTSR